MQKPFDSNRLLMEKISTKRRNEEPNHRNFTVEKKLLFQLMSQNAGLKIVFFMNYEHKQEFFENECFYAQFKRMNVAVT